MKMEFPDITLVCDNSDCDWTGNVAWIHFNLWYRKPCPKCMKSIIVNDKDMAAYHQATAAVYMSRAADPDGIKPKMTVTIDTSALRE